MAIYHCAVQIIGRNAGRSSVAAAAYRSGECLLNEYDGIEHDFTKKNWVEYTEIILPENAPSEYSDRSILWNAIELAEKSKDAQLAREFELALPVELNREQQIELAVQFAKDKLVAEGMAEKIQTFGFAWAPLRLCQHHALVRRRQRCPGDASISHEIYGACLAREHLLLLWQEKSYDKPCRQMRRFTETSAITALHN